MHDGEPVVGVVTPDAAAYCCATAPGEGCVGKGGTGATRCKRTGTMSSLKAVSVSMRMQAFWACAIRLMLSEVQGYGEIISGVPVFHGRRGRAQLGWTSDGRCCAAGAVSGAHEVKSRDSRKDALRLPISGTIMYGRFLNVWKLLLITSFTVWESVSRGSASRARSRALKRSNRAS